MLEIVQFSKEKKDYERINYTQNTILFVYYSIDEAII